MLSGSPEPEGHHEKPFIYSNPADIRKNFVSCETESNDISITVKSDNSYGRGFIYTDACLGSCLSFCSCLSPSCIFLKGNISSWSMVRAYVEYLGNWRVCYNYKVFYVL